MDGWLESWRDGGQRTQLNRGMRAAAETASSDLAMCTQSD